MSVGKLKRFIRNNIYMIPLENSDVWLVDDVAPWNIIKAMNIVSIRNERCLTRECIKTQKKNDHR